MANYPNGIQKMLDLAKKDQSFKSELNASKSHNEVMTLLKTRGIEVTATELESFTKSQGELSDMDLDKVAGGLCLIHI